MEKWRVGKWGRWGGGEKNRDMVYRERGVRGHCVMNLMFGMATEEIGVRREEKVINSEHCWGE
jgi:hypothetical protein